ncbi:hypothetical protein [Actinomadura chokoriensis]|uniref:hypothetical protein n=1 Tax=Actinomadura chokoriensis TaxID=454156 RepID=UPI0031F7EEAD
MLAVAGAETWVGLDQALRTHATVLPEGDELSWLVAACSRDGHRRESAVADPAMGAGEWSLPVLVLRTADWAPQARERARFGGWRIGSGWRRVAPGMRRSCVPPWANAMVSAGFAARSS